MVLNARSSALCRRFWTWSTQIRPSWRECPTEAAVAFVTFGITGSTSAAVVRPALSAMGLKGSLREGPWSYRVGTVVLVSPIYALILLTVGTLAGRHRFFANLSGKIWRRMWLPRLPCPRKKS